MLRAPLRPRRPILVSLSGMDGAGKSTQIANLCSVAERLGLRVAVRAFWDDVVVLKRYREGFVQKVFKSEPGVGAPERPVNRRDKNVRGWHMNLVRHGLYLLDAVHLGVVIDRLRRSSVDVIVMDRYIHDELANLPLRNPLTRAYARALAGLVPAPDLALFLDADPEAARARKPEYPVDFLHRCRSAYLELARIAGKVTVIPPVELAEAKRLVERAFEQVIGRVCEQPATSLDRAGVA